MLKNIIDKGTLIQMSTQTQHTTQLSALVRLTMTNGNVEERKKQARIL